MHASAMITPMEADLFAVVAAHAICGLDEGLPLLPSALRKEERCGAIDTAHRLRPRREQP